MVYSEAMAHTDALTSRGGSFDITPLSQAYYDKEAGIYTMVHRGNTVTTKRRNEVIEFMMAHDRDDWSIYYRLVGSNEVAPTTES